MGRRLKYVLNRILLMVILRDFQRMPGVVDEKTSPDVGDGFGLARTIDLFELIQVLFRAGTRKCKTFIDLGCGDGVVLRVAGIFNIQNIIGIESDARNHHYARINNPSASVFNCKFQDWDSSAFNFNSYVMYSFNPCEFHILLSAINKILAVNRNCKSIVLKNVNQELNGIEFNRKYSVFVWRSYKIITFS